MSEKPIEEHFADWESEVFGYGYGTGEPHTISALKKFLEAIGGDGESCYNYRLLEEVCGSEVAWLLINTLCRADIIAYGTSPRGGWLTKQGIALRNFVKSKSVDELVSIVCEGCEERDYCAPSFCNCGENGYSEKKLCFNPFWVNR